MITKRDSISRGSYFYEKYICIGNVDNETQLLPKQNCMCEPNRKKIISTLELS